ncbi:hypothetical protein [Xanthobacter flavus]|uniref:hypothetical protein n=1 Tax=Xanthobacter flavus TaxID=281 RepID=UPI00372C1595
MTDIKRYTVTDRAGPRVAGRLAKAGDVLELTTAEAAYERLQGAIVPEGAELSRAFTEDSDSLKELRDRARGAGLPPATPSVAVAIEMAPKGAAQTAGRKPKGKASAEPAAAGEGA